MVKAHGQEGIREALDLLGGIDRFVSVGEMVSAILNICRAKTSGTRTVTDPVLAAEARQQGTMSRA